ncbi:hypothetical protein [Chromatocurvus halotolerans]|uniref:Uncharacterized protein n=1 Tax=Chromatocurvus halotolerans TaxID=1132028 RepID=A0A4V2SBP5_9GAMM|nr:hypothetical protein [Chromatocurvus halotolerans]TCO76300.1 hypothetical protein EV688_105263 [Chromatocurvus halotolerans]
MRPSATTTCTTYYSAKGDVAAIADRVVEAIADWPLHAEAAGVNDRDRELVARYLRR